MEIMITLALAGVVIGIGVPSFQHFVTNSQITNDSNRFLYDVHFTRSEAVKRSRAVFMCRSSNGTSCAGGSTKNWSIGWIVFADTNNDGDYTNGTDTLLRIGEPSAKRIKIQSNVAGDSNNGRIIYMGDGRLFLPPGITAPARYAVCDDRDGDTNFDEEFGREVTINSMGNIKTKRKPADCDSPA